MVYKRLQKAPPTKHEAPREIKVPVSFEDARLIISVMKKLLTDDEVSYGIGRRNLWVDGTLWDMPEDELAAIRRLGGKG